MPADRSSATTSTAHEQSPSTLDARPRLKDKKPPACDRCKVRRLSPSNLPHITSTSREARDPVGNKLPFELDDSIVDDLFPRAGFRFTHPLVHDSGLFLAPPKTVGELAALAPDLRTLAYCALAAGALASFHSAIIGSRSDNPTSMTAVERLGPDLREFGRRRLGAFLALRDEALRRAKGGDTFYLATATHAAVCWALDFLFAVDHPVGSPRPYLSIYYTHVRALAPLRTLSQTQTQSTPWAMQLTVDHLTAIGDGSIMLPLPDLAKFVDSPELTAEAYVQDLDDALRDSKRTKQWPSIGIYAGLCVRAALELQACLSSSTLARSRGAPLDEQALLSTLGRVDLLHQASISLVAHTDRLLEACGAVADRSLFRPVPFSKVQALKSTRFFAAVAWTALVLPLYHDLQACRASSTPSPAPSSESISARFARDRLEVHISQARAYGFAALEAVMAAIERTPIIYFWTHLQPRLLPQWAEFLLAEYDAGHARAMGDQLVPTCQQLSATLLKIGYVYSNPHLDHLIERLGTVVQLEALNAAFSVPLDNPLSFLTLLSTDPFFSVPPASTSTSGPSAPASTPSVAGGAPGPDVDAGQAALPYNALPLSFRLLRPLGTGTSPSICLSVQLPLANQGASAASDTEDLRHGPSSPTVEVLRLIDPEHREPFVSLDRILLACAVTPIEVLLRYDLDRLDYSTTLAGLAPFLDLWTPLKTARKIAADLGRLDELAALLEWETRGAYSCEDKEEGGIVHNWKIASDQIPPDEYSTASMLATPFPRIHLLPAGAQVRTLLPSLLTFPSLQDRPTDAAPSLEAVWGRVVEWSIVAFEAYVDAADDDEGGETGGLEPQRTRNALKPPSAAAGATASLSNSADALAPLFLFSTVAPLLHALDLLPAPAPSPSSSASATPAPARPTATTLSHLPSLPPLPRLALLPPSTSASSRTGPDRDRDRERDAPRLPPHAQLYLVDAVARFVLHARRVGGTEGGAGRAGRGGRAQQKGREGAGEGGAARDDEEPWRLAIEKRLAALERGGEGGAGAAGSGASESAAASGASSSGGAAGVRAPAGPSEADGDALRARLASVEAQLELAQAALARHKLERAQPLAPVDLASGASGAPSHVAGPTRAGIALFLVGLVVWPAVAVSVLGVRWWMG
ncbi:hypothetical protein JCM3775_002150 [Rhodotorula graminis]